MSATEEGQDSVDPMQRVALLAHERARDGAAFLDEKVPGWTSKIKKPINIKNIRDCALGQLYGSYPKALAALNLSWQQQLNLGFQAFADTVVLNSVALRSHYYSELSRAWELERGIRVG